MIDRLLKLERLVKWLYCKVKNGGAGGGIQSVQEGDNITIDNTDPLNPIISSTGGGTTGDFMTLDSENEVINNWSISNSGNFNITPQQLSLSDYGNTDNTITLDTLSQFPRLNIEDTYTGSSLSISSRPEFLFDYQNDNENKYATFSTKSIILIDGSDSLELTPQYFRVGTSNLFANINLPLIGDYNYNLPLVNEDNELQFNHTLVASVNGQFADEYGNIEIEGGAGGDYIPLTGTEEGKAVSGDIVFEHSLLMDVSGALIAFNTDQINISNDTKQIRLLPSVGGIFIEDESLIPLGLTSENYYGENYTDNTYVQKKYVDDANSYSTTETKTGGTWIDGKPIYRKVFEGEFSSQTEFDVLNLSIADIINITTIAKDIEPIFPYDEYSGGSYPFLNGVKQGHRVYFTSIVYDNSIPIHFKVSEGSYLDNNVLYVDYYISMQQNTGDGSTYVIGNGSFKVIIEYTKTTD